MVKTNQAISIIQEEQAGVTCCLHYQLVTFIGISSGCRACCFAYPLPLSIICKGRTSYRSQINTVNPCKSTIACPVLNNIRNQFYKNAHQHHNQHFLYSFATVFQCIG